MSIKTEKTVELCWKTSGCKISYRFCCVFFVQQSRETSYNQQAPRNFLPFLPVNFESKQFHPSRSVRLIVRDCFPIKSIFYVNQGEAKHYFWSLNTEICHLATSLSMNSCSVGNIMRAYFGLLGLASWIGERKRKKKGKSHKSFPKTIWFWAG